MDEAKLFTMSEAPGCVPAEAWAGGAPRVQYAERQQVEMVMTDLDSLVPADDGVRVVWAFVERQDFSALYARIRARGERAGRNPIDPGILMALWLKATLDGVGSARRLAALCEHDVRYRWICGGVSVNHHTLSDFRVGHGAWLDGVLTREVAALLHEGLVTMERVAQDGMRTRAGAGAASYHRRATLERCLEEARTQVKALREELETDAAQGSRRRQAAQRRAAREREARVAQALSVMGALEARAPRKEPQEAEAKGPEAKEEKRKEPRVSSTDPEIPVMKMADGGFRPAVNVQFATDTAAQVIAGVAVVNTGSDLGQLVPMVEQLEARYGEGPKVMLVDGGFARKEDIETLSGPEHGCTVYAPVQKPKKSERDPHQPLAQDTPAVAAWRIRMGTGEAQTLYRDRASTAECVNAIARNRGLRQITVRGLRKILAFVLWYVLAHNLMRAHALRYANAAAG